MKAKFIRVTSAGTTVQQVEINPANCLKELQQMVEGYIEVVMGVYEDNVIGHMIINEEGKLKGLPYNELATASFRLAHETLYGVSTPDYIVGNAVVCEGEIE